MPLDDRITSVSIHPLGQIQHTREVKDEHRRKKREPDSSDKRKKDILELSGDQNEQAVTEAIPEAENPQEETQSQDTIPHIDIVIH